MGFRRSGGLADGAADEHEGVHVRNQLRKALCLPALLLSFTSPVAGMIMLLFCLCSC